MNNPLVSVFILTYNHAPFIRECIESVFSQVTNFDFEVVVGDDCSTDGTSTILKELAEKYKGRLKPIFQPKNIGFMRNGFEYCMPQCNGKYVAMLDGDDYWIDPDKLQRGIETLENDKSLSMCFTDMKYLNNNTGEYEVNPALAHIKKTRFTITDILNLNVISTSTVVFRSIFRDNLPKNFIAFPMGDWPMWLFLLLQGDALFINQQTAVYRLHQGGVYSPSNHQKRIIADISVREKLLQYNEFKPYEQLIKKLISKDAYVASSMEMVKSTPDLGLSNNLFEKAVSNFSLSNIYYPIKSFIKKSIYKVTNKNFR